jgi:hypothetical protein
LRADASAVTAIGSGLVPAPAWGFALLGTLGPPGRWAALAGLDAWRGDSVSEGRGSVSFAALSMQAGIAASVFSFGSADRLRAFAFASGGLVRAEAADFDVNRSDSRAFMAVGVAIRPEIDLGPALFLLAEGSARVLLWRPAFTYQGPDGAATLVHRADRVALSGGIGVGYKFP